MLVGKAIEHAKIEVIEAHEEFELKTNKGDFKQRKEAMLMQTQMQEGARQRKTEEVNRRNLQVRTLQVVKTCEEKRKMAGNFAKQWLKNFKKETLQQCIDLGVLRDRREYSIQT